MKRHIAILALAASGLFASSCTEESIELYGEQNYIHFTNQSSKVYRFSFATQPGKDEYTLEIPVTLIGRALENDAEYGVTVITEGENATTASGASYSLPEHPVFHKGIFEDVLSVKLFNTDELKTEKKLVIGVTDNASFKVGPAKYRTAVIYFSNVLTQPDWWDDDMASIYLGAYSDIKYQQFIIATGVTDLKDKTVAEITAYVVQFIYYLRDLDEKGTPAYESDGITKVLDTIPYSKNV